MDFRPPGLSVRQDKKVPAAGSNGGLDRSPQFGSSGGRFELERKRHGVRPRRRAQRLHVLLNCHRLTRSEGLSSAKASSSPDLIASPTVAPTKRPSLKPSTPDMSSPVEPDRSNSTDASNFPSPAVAGVSDRRTTRPFASCPSKVPKCAPGTEISIARSSGIVVASSPTSRPPRRRGEPLSTRMLSSAFA